MNRSNADLILKALALGATVGAGCAIGRWAYLVATDTPERYFHEAIAVELVWVAPFGIVPAVIFASVFLIQERTYAIRTLQRIARRRNLPASTMASFTEVLDVLREEER